MAFPQKGALKEGRTIVFCDQSGFYLLPTVVRTYAPMGETPIVREHLSRDHLSAMSGITLEGKLYMLEQDRSFKGEDVVRFLKHLIRITCFLCLNRSFALRSSTLNCARLWQQRFFNSTHLRCFQIPSSGLRSGA